VDRQSDRRRGPRCNRPYEDEPGVIEQFRPGERQARFQAVWNVPMRGRNPKGEKRPAHHLMGGTNFHFYSKKLLDLRIGCAQGIFRCTI
jgi:hypothetical protein